MDLLRWGFIRTRKPLSGSLRGGPEESCIACLEPTDTVLAFEGDAPYIVAGLTYMGVPGEQAVEVVRKHVHKRTAIFLVCPSCAGPRLPRPVRVEDGGTIPVIVDRPD